MSTLAAAMTIGWLFVHPIQHLPDGARFWLMLPLAACVATVYRATRARDTRGMALRTVKTFISIVVGMSAIALAFYAVHMAVRAFF